MDPSNNHGVGNKKARLEDDDERAAAATDGTSRRPREERLATIRQWIAKPIDAFRDADGVFRDPVPARIVVNNHNDTGVLIGNKHHAANLDLLVERGVTAVLNCASGGISRLPVDRLKDRGIRYQFTNVRQDDLKYPILHELVLGNNDGWPPRHLVASPHLQTAKALFRDVVVHQKGRLLLFCVAGQNRSATLAVALLLLLGHSLDEICRSLATTRPFCLENEGFQKQLVELEAHLQSFQPKPTNGCLYSYGDIEGSPPTTIVEKPRKNESSPVAASPERPVATPEDATSTTTDTRPRVEIELLIPGLCTMEARIPVPASIEKTKACLVDHVHEHLLRTESSRVAKAWMVLAAFGHDAEYDVPLEEEAIDRAVQWERIRHMFGLRIEEDPQTSQTVVHWTALCRFALVIFSVTKNHHDNGDDNPAMEEPWTFCHEERVGAPSTLLANTLISTRLRGWDFCDGQAFESTEPIVFSFSKDPRDRRQFMKISTCAQEAQQFHAPGEGGILGMGQNAIVHRVQLKSTSPRAFDRKAASVAAASSESGNESWDAAVKRPFSLRKMLASLDRKSEAGLGMRLRQLSHRSLLNSDGRVLYFYGLGVGLSSNAHRPHEYKFEAVILARYEEEFSTYTLQRFVKDYVSREESGEDHDWRDDFSLISVKVLLVSLLNAFRDLTLMGVSAFDFNHLGNVLVSRDFQSVKLLDIDGDSRGSIPLSEYQGGSGGGASEATTTHKPANANATPPLKSTLLRRSSGRVLHKPSLDVDLNAVLPRVVEQLVLGKRRGSSFVTNTRSALWRLPPGEARALLGRVLEENFGPLSDSHAAKVVAWCYATLKKEAPWGNWTHDIYDAMRCIDHLPVR